jgi:hypothetical protein
MDALATQVEERRAALESINSRDVQLVEFGIEGDWFGSRMRRTRHFRWMLYVALQNAEGDWIDHHEDLLRTAPRHGGWVLLQPPERALDVAERFARERLAARSR